MLATRAADAHCHIVYVNQVGGQDELVFDGALARRSTTTATSSPGRRSSSRTCWSSTSTCARCSARALLDPRGRGTAPPLPEVAGQRAPVADHAGAADRAVEPAARPGRTRSTRRSCSAPATTSPRTASPTSCSGCRAASTRRWSPRIAADALGAEHVARRVDAVALLERRLASPTPSALADDLGIELAHDRHRARPRRVPRDARPSLRRARAEDLTEENLQARIRGTLLMALSNKFGWLVLTTGNKSEMAVGYSTLYGDMAGGFAVIKDVPKLLVYELCRDRNERAGRERHPRGGAHQAAVGRAAARPARRPSRCRPTRCSTRSSRPTSRTTSRRASSMAAGFDRDDRSSASRGWSTSPSTSAARPRPACACHAEGVRQGPAPADHQPLARLSRPTRREHSAGGSPRRARSSSPRSSSASRSRSSHDALDDVTPFAYLAASGSPSRCSRSAPFAIAIVRSQRRGPAPARRASASIAGVLLFGGYATQTSGCSTRRRRRRRSSPACTCVHAVRRGASCAAGSATVGDRRHRASRPSACSC